MQPTQALPTDAFDSLLRAEELDERVEFYEWGFDGDHTVYEGEF